MADCMDFPNDWAKFLEDYSFRDHKGFYTNGARLIPTFRVEQMMHHYLRKASEDTVKVVRCKDCKHYDNSEGIQWCNLNSKFAQCGTDWHSFPEDGFCSYGERKDNEKS